MDEQPDKPAEKAITASEKMAIRDEVENRFDRPPASFTERIEKEVEKRIDHHFKYYRKMAVVVIVSVGIFLAIFVPVTLSTVKDYITRQLAEEKVTKAKDRILATADIVDGAANSVKTNQQWFLSRIADFKKQDNVILGSDFQNLFVSEAITKVPDGKFVLAYDPIPQTVFLRASYNQSYMFRVEAFGGVLEDKTVTFTNKFIAKIVAEGQLRLEYIRKSLHQ